MTAAVVQRSNQGFTLIEAMVSLVILAVILLGLQAGMMTTITMNTENLLRNEAVKLAQEKIGEYRVNGSVPDTSENVERQIRNFKVQYTVINNYGPDGKGDGVTTVEWDIKDETRTLQYFSYI